MIATVMVVSEAAEPRVPLVKFKARTNSARAPPIAMRLFFISSPSKPEMDFIALLRTTMLLERMSTEAELASIFFENPATIPNAANSASAAPTAINPF